MGENAMKTTNGDDIVFAWSEEDCRALGIERRDAILAWMAVQGKDTARLTEIELIGFGYDKPAVFSDIILLPNYSRALRIMLTQWLNVVGLPEAARTHYNMMRSEKAPEAVRIKAAKHLTDMAESMRASFIAEYDRPTEDLDPDALKRVIKHLESLRAAGLQVESVKPPERTIDVHSLVQPASADAYLADLL